jgi:hypothetical protein
MATPNDTAPAGLDPSLAPPPGFDPNMPMPTFDIPTPHEIYMVSGTIYLTGMRDI